MRGHLDRPGVHAGMVQGSGPRHGPGTLRAMAPNPGCSPGARRHAIGLGEIERLFVGIAQSLPKAPATSRQRHTKEMESMRKHVGLNSPADTEQRLSGTARAAGACHTGDVAPGRGASDCVGSCPADRRRGKAHRHRAAHPERPADATPGTADAAAVAVAVVLTAALLLGGCGTRGTADRTAPASPSSPEASEFAGGPVAVHFVLRFTEDGESYKETFDVTRRRPAEGAPEGRGSRHRSHPRGMGRNAASWNTTRTASSPTPSTKHRPSTPTSSQGSRSS